jgi:hypothetical protein
MPKLWKKGFLTVIKMDKLTCMNCKKQIDLNKATKAFWTWNPLDNNAWCPDCNILAKEATARMAKAFHKYF